MSSTASQTRDRRLAEGRCPDCGAEMLPEWETTRCPECRALHVQRTRRWQKRNAARERLRWAKVAAERMRANVDEGACITCGGESEVREDGKRRLRCIECTAIAVVKQREYRARQRAA